MRVFNSADIDVRQLPNAVRSFAAAQAAPVPWWKALTRALMPLCSLATILPPAKMKTLCPIPIVPKLL